MKKNWTYITSALIAVSCLLTSCEVIGGIFKAGVWTGIFVVVLIVAVIMFLVSKSTKK